VTRLDDITHAVTSLRAALVHVDGGGAAGSYLLEGGAAPGSVAELDHMLGWITHRVRDECRVMMSHADPEARWRVVQAYDEARARVAGRLLADVGALLGETP